MAKKTGGENNGGVRLKTETKSTIWAVVFLLAVLFFILAFFGKAGTAGRAIYLSFQYLFGVGYFLWPIILLLLGVSFTRSERPSLGWLHVLAAVLLIFSGLGIIEIVNREAGGLVGNAVALPILWLFDAYAGILVLGAIGIISLLIMFDARPNLLPFLKKIIYGLKIIVFKISAWLRTLRKKKKTDEEIVQKAEQNLQPLIQPPVSPLSGGLDSASLDKGRMEGLDEEFIEPKKLSPYKRSPAGKQVSSYSPPPMELLAGDRGRPDVGDIKANMNIIKRSLQNFGIIVEMDEVTIGPTVTRYALKPAEGVKLSRIVALQNDLALALAAHPLRIEAPIPGKSLVGIEIPNRARSTVGLATLLSDEKFTGSIKPLTVALGRNISGRPIFGNLNKMPHMLIAGATGSGKSVSIHALIVSLLYRNSPDNLRLIMVDPKRVELTLYKGIPHLLTPVITDPKKAILALKWSIKEMERRYDILETEAARDIESYHGKMAKTPSSSPLAGGEKDKTSPDKGRMEGLDPMPYIVIIIDELADIMATYPRELESSIVRLAQMSRAVGIHLVLSTQRPSVNVITGLIKANIPARVALQVSSQIDSRTILDQGGAEKLLGAGDMLWSAPESAHVERLQSAFISEEEVKKVTKYLVKNYHDDSPDDIDLGLPAQATNENSFETSIFDGMSAGDDGTDDEMYEEAKRIVLEAGKASTSYLQRRLKLGYARAARIIDMLEERGIVGPADGAKPREVLRHNEFPPPLRPESEHLPLN